MDTVLTRRAPTLLALALFAVAVATCGAGWFEDQRGETLAKALLATTVLIGVAAVVAAGLWVIGTPRAQVGWLAAAALVLAAPLDVVAPVSPGSVRVAVVPLLDAAQITAGVTDRPQFAYQEAVVFPSSDGLVLPHWPFLQLVLGAAVVFVIARASRHGARERLMRLVFIGPPRGAHRS